MTPQARIKARVAEEAAATGVRVAVRARKSKARYFTDHLVDGTAYYVLVSGGWQGSREFMQRMFPEAGLTSGGPMEVTYSLLPEHVERMLTETELDPDWLKGNAATALQLARGIQADLGFERLPILADALEEAGCTNRFVLDHCRASDLHDKTCWVIELLLGSPRKRRGS